MAKVFFTGDLHFGHENIIKFDHRPFASVEEMDAELIRRWNAKVTAEDTVYVVGDLFWKTRNDQAHEILRRLNGSIVLIRGNHDRFLTNAKAIKELTAVKDYDDICVTLDNGYKKRVILCHYYIPMYPGARYGGIHLHAHSHFSQEAAMEEEIQQYLLASQIPSKAYNVGCMYWNYEPVTLDEILSSGAQSAK